MRDKYMIVELEHSGTAAQFIVHNIKSTLFLGT